MKKISISAVSVCASLYIYSGSAQAEVDEDRFTGRYVAQQKLNSMGYNVGEPDGVIGSKTLSAIRADALKNGYEDSIFGFQEFYIGKVATESKPYKNEEQQEKIKNEIGRDLLDPYSAKYENWRILPSGAICVDVNAKNAYGAYAGRTPFYVTVFFNSIMPISTSEHFNFWRCYLDPEAP